jgi:TIR domain-containing protein/von Hippel-Lindau disease tumor suppressor protein
MSDLKLVSEPNSRLFISYRRDDSAGHAGRLYDRLSSLLGEGRMFMDIDSIEPGDDFVRVIEEAVTSCKVLVAVIGKHWLRDATGAARPLNDPNDFVRIEIVAALNRNIRVIPVLVQGAVMPHPEELPEVLASFARRQALEISDQRWGYDVGRLIKIVEQELAERSAVSVERERSASRLRNHPPEQEKSYRSLDSKHPATLKFINQTNIPIRLYWLDFTGNRVFYNSLLPGQFYVQNTFINHPWLVTDMSDEPIALFVPEVESGEAIIQ